MNKKSAVPGVSREARISDQSLQRLEQQLARGARISQLVLMQWVKRYGEAARVIIKRHGQYTVELGND